MNKPKHPAFLERLKTPSFLAASKKGTFIYAYLRSKSGSNGKAGSPYYIGLSSSSTRPYGKHTCVVPKDFSRIRILRVLSSWEEAAKWEKFYIDKFGRIDLGTGILRNLTDGGEGVSSVSLEARKKISEKAKRPEKIAMLRELAKKQRGVKVILTPEQKLAIGRPGHKKSEEWKKKMSAIQTGRQRSEAELKKLRISKLKKSCKLRASWAHSVGLKFLQVKDLSPADLRNLKIKSKKGYRGNSLFLDLRNLTSAERKALQHA